MFYNFGGLFASRQNLCYNIRWFIRRERFFAWGKYWDAQGFFRGFDWEKKVTKKELNKWIDELRYYKYLERKGYADTVHAFAERVKKDDEADELAGAYADLNLTILDLRDAELKEDVMKRLVSVLQVSANHKDYKLEAECHNLLGIVVSHLVDKTAGLEHFEKSFAVAKKHRYLLYQSVAANNIGDVYSSMGEYDQALEYLRESYRLLIDMEKKIGNYGKATSPLGITRINVCFMNMAEVHYKKGNYEEAFRMLSCIDGIDDQKGSPFYKTSIIILKCLIFIKMGSLKDCEPYFEGIFSNAEGNEDSLQNVEDYITLAGALSDAGEFDRAGRLLAAAEKIVKKIDLDDKWCFFLKTKIRYMKAAEPDKDRTALYEAYFEHRDIVDELFKERQLTSLKNKKKLEEEIRKRNNAEEKNRKLKAMSEHDQLTGVYNRYAMNELGSAWFKDAKEKNTKLAFMIIDIDYFKEYNDTYGHLGGDEVLKSVGSVLLECTTDNELVIRYGGDEFFIISKSRNEDEVIALGAMINRKVNEKKIRHSASLVSDYVTLSFGAVCGKVMKDQTLIDAIHLADNGLYRIKNVKRNALGLFRQVDDDFEFECVNFE